MMADFAPIHPLGDETTFENAGITCVARPFTCVAQLFASAGKQTALVKQLKTNATPGKASETVDFTALPLAPGQWMLIAKKDDPKFITGLAMRIAGLGYVSEQSDSRICIRVSGPKARELMSRGCRLDLHPDGTGKGFCAQTPMAQIGVLLHQIDDAPVYDLYVYSGFARSFWHWLTETAKQFDKETVAG